MTGSLAGMHVNITGSLALFGRLFAYIDRVPEITDDPAATEFGHVDGAVRLDHVSFTYPGGASPAVDGITADIEPGQLVALVGPSGVRQLAQKVDWSTLTTDSTGDSIVAWFRYINSAQSAVFGCRVSRPALGPVVKLGLGYVPAIMVDPAGAGLVAWQSTSPGSGALTRVYARPFAAATGKFGSQVTLTPDGDYVRLAESWAGSSPPSGSSPRYRGRSAPASAVRRQSLTAAAEVTYRSADLASS